MVENYGILSLLPPLVAIILAIVTREVYLSLLLGILVGTFILNDGNLLNTFVQAFDIMFEKVGDPSWNIRLVFYMLLLGSVIGLAVRSGGSAAFARWAAERIHSRKGSQGVAFGAGILIFLDDYFNCLTVGSVLRPVADRFRLSREKLAYIIDSTAAPVTILAPVSSWVAYIIGILTDQFNANNIATGPFLQFLYTIPFNLYAWLALIMVAITIFTRLEFGPMARAEKRALMEGQVYDPAAIATPGDDLADLDVSERGKPVDMFLPVLILVVTSVLAMLYTGGYFEGGKTIAQSFQDTDSITALFYAAFITLVISVGFYRVRGVLYVNQSMTAVIQGMKSMLSAVLILALAWTIGGVVGKLGTGAYVAEVVNANLPAWLVPAAIFLVACLMAFATGTSWGTFAVMIPITVPLVVSADINMTLALGALFSGAIFGDHCSPLSDTTILSSTGAGCPHIDHVRTQLPYALTVAVASLAGFLVAGLVSSVVLALAVGLAVLVALVLALGRLNRDTIELLGEKTARPNP